MYAIYIIKFIYIYIHIFCIIYIYLLYIYHTWILYLYESYAQNWSQMPEIGLNFGRCGARHVKVDLSGTEADFASSPPLHSPKQTSHELSPVILESNEQMPNFVVFRVIVQYTSMIFTNFPTCLSLFGLLCIQLPKSQHT